MRANFRLIARLHDIAQATSGWAWTPLFAKSLLWLGAFVALAHVGSETALQLAVPQVAVAAPRPPPRASPSASSSTTPSQAGSAVASAAASSTPCPTSSAPSGGFTADGRVVLNVATTKNLQSLPGIGLKRAQAIVAMRERLGRFRRVRDLLRIRGIGYRSLKKLQPLVVVDLPKSAGRPSGKEVKNEAH